MRLADVPDFGVLRNVKVLSTGSNVAGPFAAGLMAEFGAKVIQLENAKVLDPMRVVGAGMSWATEHRNQRDLAVDLQNPVGLDVFKRLLGWCDIWIEASKGGTTTRWGLTDEAVWEIKPDLVIAHVSGYGQSGVEDHVRRPSYDGTAQAYSGYMHWNGYADTPMRVKPYTADYVPPIMAALAAVSALMRARETGVGESIDIAQYEVMVRLQGLYLLQALNTDRMPARTGNAEAAWAVYEVFGCRDGSLLVIIMGRTMWARALDVFGLAGDSDFAEVLEVVPKPSAAADKANQAVAAFCAQRTVSEAESALNAAGIACSRVTTPEDMVTDPHYEARATLTTWDDHVWGRQLHGPNIVPKFKNNPAQIWRSGPALSEDAVDILDELGYSADEREAIFEAGAALRP